MAWTNPKTWSISEVVTAAMMNTHVRDNENWIMPVPGAWTAYTPSWTSDGAAPNMGAPSGKYFRSGNLVIAQINFTLSVGGGSPGTGAWYFTLPVTAVSSISTGTGVITDTSVPASHIVHPVSNTTTTIFLLTTAQPGQRVGAGQPFTWSSTDTVNVTHIYEAA